MACLWVVIRVGRMRRQVTAVPDEYLSPGSPGTEPGLQTIFIFLFLDSVNKNDISQILIEKIFSSFTFPTKGRGKFLPQLTKNFVHGAYSSSSTCLCKLVISSIPSRARRIISKRASSSNGLSSAVVWISIIAPASVKTKFASA